MKLTLLENQRLWLDTAPGEGLQIEGEHFGPLEMLAASLALCTASVVQTYGETAHLQLAGFAVELAWQFAERPYRVSAYTVTLHLPATVDQGRHRAILRAAETCTVHNTLVQSPAIVASIAVLDPTAQEPHRHVHQA